MKKLENPQTQPECRSNDETGKRSRKLKKKTKKYYGCGQIVHVTIQIVEQSVFSSVIYQLLECMFFFHLSCVVNNP